VTKDSKVGAQVCITGRLLFKQRNDGMKSK
jgi:hypothetical protein